jgi:radical SAM superfamily enzyme YgiQ (UPF0313 family)
MNSPQAIPLAAAILKTYQPYKKEVEVTLKDFYLNDTPKKAAENILKCSPDSIGFSMYIWNRDFLLETASIIRKCNKDITLYAGGAEITASALSLIDNKNLDFLIRGEAELPFVNLLNYLTGKVISKPDKLLKMAYVNDLELIPSPFLSLNLDPADWDGILWELSRGCPYNCSFCSESRGVKGVRYYNEDRIKNELILFEEKKVEQVFVLDPTFNINSERALRIMELIKKYASDIHFTFEIRAELLDERLAESFAELNCSLQIGLQSSQIKVLKNVNRTLNPGEFSKKIDLLNKYGTVFGLDLIYGLPGDSLQGFLKSLDFALYQIPNHIDVFRLSVFPGTQLYEKAEYFELLFEKNAPYHVISGPGYSESELDYSEKITDAVNIFYNTGRAAPWFLSVVDILNIAPSKFFIDFTDFLTTQSNHGNIYKLQYRFLKYIFNSGHKTDYLLPVLDLCKFHNLYSEALYSEISSKKNLGKTSFSFVEKYERSSVLKWAVFSYDVSFFAEQGMIDIKSFIDNNIIEESYALIFNNGHEIETISIEKYLYNLIEKITGRYSIIEILQQLNLEFDTVEEFLIFLFEEQLIVPVKSGE